MVTRGELTLTYCLGRGCTAYSVTKAAQLHLMRCLASTEGPKVRVNAVLPGWLATEWVCILLLLYSWGSGLRIWDAS